jgi:hypothetical protein
MFVSPNLCLSCEHFSVIESSLMVKRCAAFRQGIPPHVWEGASHLEPFQDGSDGGLSYEPAENQEEGMAAYFTFWYGFEEEMSDTGPVE